MNRHTDVGIWYCPYYFTSPYDLWEMPYGTGKKVEYRPLCSDVPGDFRKYDADDPDVIDFHLRQLAEAKIDFLLFELSPAGLGSHKMEENNWSNISVKNAREVCKRIKAWNDNRQNGWKIRYALCGGCHSGTWGLAPGLVMEDIARDVFESFFENPEYGGADSYYHKDGKPLLVFWGYPDSVSNHWANYGGDKSYGSRFALRTAAWCQAGEYGWNISPTGPVIHGEVEVVSPGWGHYLRDDPPYVGRRSGAFYKNCWEKLLRHPLPEIVMIASFNDYWENTAVWTSDTENLTDADKWRDQNGEPNPSMYWDMTKHYIEKLRGGAAGYGMKFEELNLMAPGSGSRVLHLLTPHGAKEGAKFTADFTVTDVVVSCPKAHEASDMTFYLYRWDTDYDTTVASKPVWVDSETGAGYPGNGSFPFELAFELGGGAPAGTYLWLLEGAKGSPGFWAESGAKPGGDPGVVFFRDGQIMDEYIPSRVCGYSGGTGG